MTATARIFDSAPASQALAHAVAAWNQENESLISPALSDTYNVTAALQELDMIEFIFRDEPQPMVLFVSFIANHTDEIRQYSVQAAIFERDEDGILTNFIKEYFVNPSKFDLIDIFTQINAEARLKGDPVDVIHYNKADISARNEVLKRKALYLNAQLKSDSVAR